MWSCSVFQPAVQIFRQTSPQLLPRQWPSPTRDVRNTCSLKSLRTLWPCLIEMVSNLLSCSWDSNRIPYSRWQSHMCIKATDHLQSQHGHVQKWVSEIHPASTAIYLRSFDIGLLVDLMPFELCTRGCDHIWNRCITDMSIKRTSQIPASFGQLYF
jgi:hypothetical protein